jgi:hypothetical protein
MLLDAGDELARPLRGQRCKARWSPPPLPRQIQVHGLVRETGDAVPALHNPVVGALVVATL